MKCKKLVCGCMVFMLIFGMCACGKKEKAKEAAPDLVLELPKEKENSASDSEETVSGMDEATQNEDIPEKKGILILILVSIVIIAVIYGLTRGSKDNNTNTNSSQSSNTEQSQVDASRGEFTKTESDGTVVNTSDKLKENKVESGFEISNINFSEKDGHTSLEADVTNMTGSAQGNFMADIVLLDKEGKEQGRIPVAIPETQIGETVGIQAGINDQYANAYNFRLEKK